jgi:hypothetical protein
MLYPYAIPKSGFIGHGGASGYTELDLSSSHNKESTDADAQVYPLGTIIGYYNASLKGYGACAYMSCTQVSAGSIIAGRILTLTAGSHTDLTDDASAGSVGDYALECGACGAIAMSTMTTLYYGWFWIKGVCPDLYTSASAKLSATTLTCDGGMDTAMDGFTAGTTDGTAAIYNRDAASNDLVPMGMSLAADGGGTTIALAYIRLFGFGWGI